MNRLLHKDWRNGIEREFFSIDGLLPHVLINWYNWSTNLSQLYTSSNVRFLGRERGCFFLQSYNDIRMKTFQMLLVALKQTMKKPNTLFLYYIRKRSSKPTLTISRTLFTNRHSIQLWLINIQRTTLIKMRIMN